MEEEKDKINLGYKKGIGETYSILDTAYKIEKKTMGELE
jgi:K+-sensing histidine kinase KdpD